MEAENAKVKSVREKIKRIKEKKKLKKKMKKMRKMRCLLVKNNERNMEAENAKVKSVKEKIKARRKLKKKMKKMRKMRMAESQRVNKTENGTVPCIQLSAFATSSVALECNESFAVDYSCISMPKNAFRAIYVSHIVNPGEFYCHIEEDSDKLKLLMKNIEEIYAVESDHLNLSNFAVDSPCCAFKGWHWYRGKIKNVGNDTCDILFVDYGYTNCIQKTKIKKLKPDLLHLPPQAVCCKALNILPKFQDWKYEEVYAFIERALDKSFVAQFIEYDSKNVYAVKLFSIDKLENINFNEEFVHLGYRRRQVSNNLKDQAFKAAAVKQGTYLCIFIF